MCEALGIDCEAMRQFVLVQLKCLGQGFALDWKQGISDFAEVCL